MTEKQEVRNRRQQRIAIVAGLRTPFAKQATAFNGISALDMGAWVVNELLQKTDLEAKWVEQLIYGQVIPSPAAPNIAREIVLATDMSVNTDAYSVSRACATGFQSTVSIAESIMAGNIEIGISGGADSTSVLPITVSKKLAGALLALSKAKTLSKKISVFKGFSFKDLLPVAPAIAEYSTGLSMGQTAEQMAKTYGISRRDQDEFAHRSHQLAAKTWQSDLLRDEVMVTHVPPYKHFISQDNCIRSDSKLDDYAKLKPVFDRKRGTVTAANSSVLTDGASALLLMSEDKAKSMGYSPIGFIKSYAFTAIGVKQDMLLGPAFATPLALSRAGLELEDIDLIELHEAFASQALANMQLFESKQFAEHKLGRNRAIGQIDMDKFNVLGGSIAYGHPFAATGGRLITQLCHELKRRGGGLGLTTACAAGGLGAAMVLEVE